MDLNHQPTLRKPYEGRSIAVVGDVYRFLATGEDTNGKYALWEAIVPPGGGPPPHVHSREEEGFFILEGEIILRPARNGSWRRRGCSPICQSVRRTHSRMKAANQPRC
jgi:hypothetical protein